MRRQRSTNSRLLLARRAPTPSNSAMAAPLDSFTSADAVSIPRPVQRTQHLGEQRPSDTAAALVGPDRDQPDPWLPGHRRHPDQSHVSVGLRCHRVLRRVQQRSAVRAGQHLGRHLLPADGGLDLVADRAVQRRAAGPPPPRRRRTIVTPAGGSTEPSPVTRGSVGTRYSHSRRRVVKPARSQRDVRSRSASSTTVYSGFGRSASMASASWSKTAPCHASMLRKIRPSGLREASPRPTTRSSSTACHCLSATRVITRRLANARSEMHRIHRLSPFGSALS